MKTWSTIIGGILLAVLPLTAQGISVWKETGNASALTVDSLADSGTLSLIRTGRDGAFKRPQEAERITQEGFLSSGAYTFGGWQTAGEFRYTNNVERSVQWVSVAEPYRGNPYLWADTNGGDWYSRTIGVRTSVGSPQLFGLFRIGTAIDYSVTQGNRRNDPRPLYRVRTIVLRPSITIPLGADHSVGGMAAVGWRSEDDEIGYYTVDFSRVVRLRGLGTSDHIQVSSQERMQRSRSLDWSGNYHGTFGPFDAMVTASRGAERDTVVDGIADPDSAGSFLRDRSSVRTVLQYADEFMSFAFDLSQERSEGYGVDPVYLRTNYRVQEEAGRLAVGWWIGRNIYHAPFGGTVRLHRRKFGQRNITAKTLWDVQRISAAASLFGRTHLIPGAEVIISAEHEVPLSVSGTYSALRPTPLTPILVRPDYDVHVTRFMRTAASISFDFPLSSQHGIMNSLSLHFQSLYNTGTYETGEEIGSRTHSEIRWDIHF
jgi:hypothetical protein